MAPEEAELGSIPQAGVVVQEEEVVMEELPIVVLLVLEELELSFFLILLNHNALLEEELVARMASTMVRRLVEVDRLIREEVLGCFVKTVPYYYVTIPLFRVTSLAVIPTARVDFLTLVVGVEEWAMFMRSLLPEVRKLVAEGLAWWFFVLFARQLVPQHLRRQLPHLVALVFHFHVHVQEKIVLVAGHRL